MCCNEKRRGVHDNNRGAGARSNAVRDKVRVERRIDSCRAANGRRRGGGRSHGPVGAKRASRVLHARVAQHQHLACGVRRPPENRAVCVALLAHALCCYCACPRLLDGTRRRMQHILARHRIHVPGWTQRKTWRSSQE